MEFITNPLIFSIACGLAAVAGLALALCYMAKRGDNRMKKHFDDLREAADKNR